MATGGNEIKFKFDPEAIADDTSFKNIVTAPEPPAEETPPAPENTPDNSPPENTQQSQQPPTTSKETTDSDVKPPSSPDTKGTGVTDDKPGTASLTDEAVLAYYNKKKGTDFKTFDDFIQTQEVEKVVEKEPELPEDVQAFLKYKKETGRGIDEYIALQRDFSKMSNLDLARDAVRAENKGLELSSSEIDILLADKFGIEPDDFNTLEGKDLIRLKAFANKRLQELVTDQQKYRLPTESTKSPQQDSQPVSEQVRLSNGQMVSKEVYQRQRSMYEDGRTQAIAGLNAIEYEVPVDDNSTIKVKYDITDEDRHSMRSITEDVNNLYTRYQQGENYNFSAFVEDTNWSQKGFRDKIIPMMMQNAYSQGIDKVMQEKKNINFSQEQKPPRESKVPEGYANDKIGASLNGSYGIKFALPTD